MVSIYETSLELCEVGNYFRFLLMKAGYSSAHLPFLPIVMIPIKNVNCLTFRGVWTKVLAKLHYIRAKRQFLVTKNKLDVMKLKKNDQK